MIITHVFITNPYEWNRIEYYLLRIEKWIRKIVVSYPNPDDLSFSETWTDRFEVIGNRIHHPIGAFLDFVQNYNKDDDEDWIMNLCMIRDDESFIDMYDMFFPKILSITEELFDNIEKDADMVGPHCLPHDFAFSEKEKIYLERLGCCLTWTRFDDVYPQWRSATPIEKRVLSRVHKFYDLPQIDYELIEMLFSKPSVLDANTQLRILSHVTDSRFRGLVYLPRMICMMRFRMLKNILRSFDLNKMNDWDVWERVIPLHTFINRGRIKIIES